MTFYIDKIQPKQGTWIEKRSLDVCLSDEFDDSRTGITFTIFNKAADCWSGIVQFCDITLTKEEVKGLIEDLIPMVKD